MVEIKQSVRDDIVSSLTEYEDRIIEYLQQNTDSYEEVADQIEAMYANIDAIIQKLEETLDDYASKIPFVEVNSLEELAESLKKAAEMGALLGGTIALSPVIMPYFEYTDGAADEPIIGLIMGAIIGGGAVVLTSAFSPLAAALMGAAYATVLCGLSFQDIKEKYYSEFKKAV